MEIRCKKEDCKHNTGCSCSAHDVHISKGEHCATYSCNPIKDKLIKHEGDIFHVADDMAKEHLNNCDLDCDAKNCIFNKSKHCHANGITVTDGETCADCATYCKE